MIIHNRFCFLHKFSSASRTTASGDVSGAPETESLMTDDNTAINQQPKTRRSVCFQNSLWSDLD